METEQIAKREKVFIVIIYDIIDDKKRKKFSTFLQGYGFRVQKSAFEIIVLKKKYIQLLKQIPKYIEKQDNVRIYKIAGKGQRKIFGENHDVSDEDIIVI